MCGHSSIPLITLNFAHYLPRLCVVTIYLILSDLQQLAQCHVTHSETYPPGVLESVLWISILFIHTCPVSKRAEDRTSLCATRGSGAAPKRIGRMRGRDLGGVRWEAAGLGVGRDHPDWDTIGQEMSLLP